MERLWVPFTHSQEARHWNCAASGASVSAWRAPRRASMFTPLSTVGASVWVMSDLPVRASARMPSLGAHSRRTPAARVMKVRWRFS